MKVSDLFAEIGFNVNTSGLVQFSKIMDDVKETIKGCVSGLKEFVKAANEINKAVERMKTSYIPSQKEAERRYRAETYYLRSAGKELRGRAIMESGKGSLFQVNADLRERQEQRLWESLELRKARESRYAAGGGVVSEGVTIGTIIGNIVSKAITGLFSHLKSWFMGIVSFVKDTIRAAMAYRDYRTFTGRSVSELSGLMGLTAYTTSMTPQDILKDAQGFQKQYWDMWFGKASPEAWMRLGVLPTGNGAQDLRNVLSAIYNISGKGTNTGLAASLLSTFGLDEQYMNIFKAMREGRENEFLVMDEQIDAFEKANNKINEFTQTIQQLKLTIVDVLLESGLDDLLKSIIDTLRGMFAVTQTNEFKNASPLGKLSMIATAPSMTEAEAKATKEYGEIMTTELSWLDKLKLGVADIGGEIEYLFQVPGFRDHQKFMQSRYDWALQDYNNRVSIVNQFDFSGRTTDELADGVDKTLSSEKGVFQLNGTYCKLDEM